MKRFILILLCLICVTTLFATNKPSLDGRAVVADEGVLPRGLFAKTVGYLPGDSVSVTNPTTGVTINVLVLGSLDPTSGVAILLSPEAADKLFITPDTNVQVKITKRTGLLDESVYGSAVITADPDKNASASIPEEIEQELNAKLAEEELSEEIIPEELVSEETAAEYVPEEIIPEELVSEETAAEDVPEEIVPEELVSEETVAEDVPEEIIPEELVSEEIVAEDVPEEIIPEELVSEETAAEDVPEEIIPEELVSEETAAEDVPEEIIPEEPVAEDVPEEIVPEEPAAEDVPEEIIPEELVSEETAAEDVPEEIIPEEPVAEEELDDPFAPIILIPAEENPPKTADIIIEPEPVVQPVETPAEEETKPVEIEAPAEEPVITPVEAPVSETVVETTPNKYRNIVDSLADLEKGKYYIQIATLSEEENINNLLNTYGKKYPIVMVPLKSGKAYQIMVGPLTIDEYGTVLSRFKSYGYKDAFLRKIR